MVWEISHSPEAWKNARNNLEEWSTDQLISALVDDFFEEQEESGADYDTAMLASDELRGNLKDSSVTFDMLVDMVMETIRAHNLCSNGGCEFWIDRQGYHTVSVENED